MHPKKIEEAVHAILFQLDDPEREGLKKTPERVAKFYQEFFGKKKFNLTRFKHEKYNQMVVVNHSFWSMCEHHCLPFYGTARVGYIPDVWVVGLSKLPRVVDFFAHRLQIQERLCDQIVDYLAEKLQPKGVMVVLEAEHLCMSMRGVQKPGHLTVTSAVRGAFEEKVARDEFFELVKRKV